ncbi:hypothetical protein ACNKHP_25785 [Shigella boydii]
MPTTIEATKPFQAGRRAVSPGKAANAGGVATSGLEMAQNVAPSWKAENVDTHLRHTHAGYPPCLC